MQLNNIINYIKLLINLIHSNNNKYNLSCKLLLYLLIYYIIN